MADRYAGGIKAGSTSVSIEMLLRSATDSTEMTSKVAADCTVTYRRQGGTRQTVTLTNLAAIDSAWTSGGFKEDADGLYRIDIPDAAFSAVGGADFVFVEFKCAGSYVSHREIPLESKGAAEVYAQVAAGITALPAAVWAVGTRTLTSLGSLAADTATAVWAASVRTLSSFGFNVSLATSVWAETPSTGAGTAGQLLTAAGTAADPLLNPVPGSYLAGTAGYVIGNISSESANIAAVKAKTDQLTFTTPNVVDANASGAVTPAQVATAVLNTVMTEAYAADGAQVTLSQALYMIHQFLTERSVSGTTMTIKKLDGTSTAAVVTMNSATNPTAYTRTA